MKSSVGLNAIKRENWTQTNMTWGECHMKTQGEDGPLQATERSLEYIFPSQHSEGSNTVDT